MTDTDTLLFSVSSTKPLLVVIRVDVGTHRSTRSKRGDASVDENFDYIRRRWISHTKGREKGTTEHLVVSYLVVLTHTRPVAAQPAERFIGGPLYTARSAESCPVSPRSLVGVSLSDAGSVDESLQGGGRDTIPLVRKNVGRPKPLPPSLEMLTFMNTHNTSINI